MFDLTLKSTSSNLMRYLKEGRFIYSEYYGSYLDNYCQNIEEENVEIIK